MRFVRSLSCHMQSLPTCGTGFLFSSVGADESIALGGTGLRDTVDTSKVAIATDVESIYRALQHKIVWMLLVGLYNLISHVHFTHERHHSQ